ncbi:I78 family peptidase inhibitor [Pseudomonas sp. NY15181]|uniref:I78 family peptidase inhibitor n=1 Tax=Pseudomonas sp. NY15181 TaxID=3400349 RepID=UPI003A870E04
MPLNRVTLLSLFAVAALAGCSAKDTSSDAASPSPSAPSASCDAKAAQALIGKIIDPTLTEQARRDAGASVARVLRPHQPVTMEYNSQRLNIDVDDRQVVQQVNCG